MQKGRAFRAQHILFVKLTRRAFWLAQFKKKIIFNFGGGGGRTEKDRSVRRLVSPPNDASLRNDYVLAERSNVRKPKGPRTRRPNLHLQQMLLGAICMRTVSSLGTKIICPINRGTAAAEEISQLFLRETINWKSSGERSAAATFLYRNLPRIRAAEFWGRFEIRSF